MSKDIYDSLTEYVNVFRDRFKEVCKEAFDELAAEANVDIEANHETCRKYYIVANALSITTGRVNMWTALCALMGVGAFGGIAALIANCKCIEWYYSVAIGAAVLIDILLLFLCVYPRIKKLKAEREDLSDMVARLRRAAWKQMAPLNGLYDWDILTRMISKTVPRLEFDPYFTTQRLADLKTTSNWDDSFNDERSVLYSHSGLINGNPFVISRTRKMSMGSKTYYGSKTIYWKTEERDEDGEWHTVSHTEVLTASVTAPYPNYYEKTRLIYGNTAAPDLIFNRSKSGLAGKDGSIAFKLKRHSLRRKARKLTDGDFAMMTNEEFEVAFNSSNRNNNQQFALLFTPLAQESMLKLLKDKEVAYGDDFNFDKNKMINIIIPDHMQGLSMDMNPDLYKHFDYDKAKKNFHTLNAEYFRAIYFSLAPFLCVPMYQQIRPASDIYGLEMPRRSSFWEHEALANFWGQDRFKDPSCVTDCILKTSQTVGSDGSSTITVHAYGYRSVQRLTYITKWGGDGCRMTFPYIGMNTFLSPVQVLSI